MRRLDRWLSLGLILTLGFLLGVLGFSLWDKMPSAVEHVAWSPEAQWVGSQEPSYRFYARRTFYLTGTLDTAWLRLSSDRDFILYVNGQAIARQMSNFNNSLGLGSRLSLPFQDLNDSVGYRVKSGENYLLAHFKDWKLTTYVDLTHYLNPGKNVIALEIQKPQKNPRVVVEGGIYSEQGAQQINITTGATPWQVSTLPENHQDISWFEPDFPDQSWPQAKVVGIVEEDTYSRLSQHLFDSSIQGSWITGTESPKGEVWLRGNWSVPEDHRRAFIRFSGDGEYALLLNGLLVKRFGVNDGNNLHMYEVTNFLKTGHNTLVVRLAHPLDPDWSAASNGSLGFLLDGWVETTQNTITAPIATDSTWSAVNQPISNWAENFEQDQPVAILRAPNPQNIGERHFEGNAYLLNYPNYLLHNGLWCLGGMSCALIYAWCLGRFWLKRRNSLSAGTGLLLPGTLFLIGIGLLKHRYAQAERGLLFVQPQSTPLILFSFLVIVILTLLWSKRGCHRKYKPNLGLEILLHRGLWFLLGLSAFVVFGLAAQGMTFYQSACIFLVFLSFTGIVALIKPQNYLGWNLRDWVIVARQTWSSSGQWLLLFLIVAIGFGLRMYDLDFTARDSDENTSLDAARGILRTGAPEASSGVWYTRGSLYHYILALWLRLVGYSDINARFLSVLFGTATIVLIFIFTRKITGKFWISIIVTIILAIDPFEIWYSRNIRFYQPLQFSHLLAAWFFLKGFIYREGRTHQYAYFVCMASTLLIQEVTITLLPYYLLGFTVFYRPFRLSVDWQLILSSLMMIGVYIYDGIFFIIKCLTPWVALSSTTETQLKFHLGDVTGFISALFFGASRMYTLYTFFFLLVFVYFLRRQEKKVAFLFCIVFTTLIFLTLMVMQIGTRYAYSVYPLFIMLSVYSAISLMENLGRRFEFILNGVIPLRNIGIGFAILILINNVEIDRVLAGYKEAFSRQNPLVFEYIRTHQQPGDIVMANLPSASAIASGRLDYYLPPGWSLGMDGVYMHEGRLIDRWAGGVAVTNLDQMTHILEKAKRVWIQLDDRLPPDDLSLLSVHQYFQNLGQPVLDTFGVRLRLWKREDGLFPRVPNQGKDLGIY